jgi:hypothetical protein
VTIGGKHPWALGRPAAEVWSARCPQSPLDAFKYTFEGEIRVTMKPSPRDGRVEFSVEDTGIGIPASELRGQGIGLALVQELVKLHGGDMRVASEIGKGSTSRCRSHLASRTCRGEVWSPPRLCSLETCAPKAKRHKKPKA